VFGFAHHQMTGYMPDLFSSKALEATLEVGDMNIGREVTQDSNDGQRNDEESLKPLLKMDPRKLVKDSIEELRKDTAESLKLLEGEMQEMKRYMVEALVGKGKIQRAYIPAP
jgi:hypothetical protein